MKNSKRKILLASTICSIVAMQGMVASADINADINGDGKVSAMDILLVKKNVLNIIPQSSFKFDINNDGFVNVLDLNLVKNNSFITTNPPQTEAPKTSKVTNPPATEAPKTDPPITEAPKTEPPQTEAPVTEPPQTEPDNNDPMVTAVIDGKGNVYDEAFYAKIGDVCFLQGEDGYETAQNYAAAIEAYYGIPMLVYGSSVTPACYENFDTIGTLEELNAWRAGRSPEEIGPAEISNNWSLIANDIDFQNDCVNYLDSLGLNRDFLVFD